MRHFDGLIEERDRRVANAISRLREGAAQIIAILESRDDWSPQQDEVIHLAMGDIIRATDFLEEEA
jgi:hypothetical protein